MQNGASLHFKCIDCQQQTSPKELLWSPIKLEKFRKKAESFVELKFPAVA